MAPLSPELREQINQLAATLENVAISYRYAKARAMLDPEYAERVKEQQRRSARKKYENPEYRAKQIQKFKDYQPIAVQKQKEKYHSDQEFREKKNAKAREWYQKNKARQAGIPESTECLPNTDPNTTD
jgi:replication initiation and membrane attachment protein DnaB